MTYYIKKMKRNYFVLLKYEGIYKITYIKILQEFNSIKKHKLNRNNKKEEKVVPQKKNKDKSIYINSYL